MPKGMTRDRDWAENWRQRGDEEIALAWIDYQARWPLTPPKDPVEDEAWWAVDAMMGLSGDDPLRALEICFLVARSSKEPKVLEMLGVGPLEDLLSEDPTLFDAIAFEARSNDRLLVALGSMWQSTIPEQVWSDLQRLIGR